MLPYSTQTIDQSDIDVVVNAMKHPYLTCGPMVEMFENELTQYTGAKYAVVFNSATSALYGAYHAIGVSLGDELITSPISFVATTNMMLPLGGKPVFVDVKHDGNIDEEKIESKITKNTKAIVAIDYAGRPAQMDTLQNIAQKNNIKLISDSSHALGSSYKNNKVGNIADISVFSFHPVKPITTFEGGAALTNNKAWYETLKRVRSHGIESRGLWKQDMVDFGYNFRLPDLACALGINQLKKLDSHIKQRNTIAKYYDQSLDKNIFVETLPVPNFIESSYHLYPVLLKENVRKYKEEIFTALRKRGIGCQVHYRPIYLNTYYQKNGFEKISCPSAENFYEREISIPCHQNMEIEDAKRVIEILNEVIDQILNTK